MKIITHDIGPRSCEKWKRDAAGAKANEEIVTAEIELVIDVEALLRDKGASALLAASGKTTLVGGAIVIRCKAGTRRVAAKPAAGQDGGQ